MTIAASWRTNISIFSDTGLIKSSIEKVYGKSFFCHIYLELDPPIGECFEDVANFDIWRTIDVGDSTSNTKYPVVDASREVKSLCRRYGDFSCFFRDFGEGVDVGIRHFCISVKSGSVESPSLDPASFFYDFCVVSSRLFSFFPFEFAGFHPRNLDENIDTVEDRTRETPTIALDRMRTTDAGFLRIAHIATRTRVHGAHQRKTTWIPTTHVHTIDRDLAIFERLAKGLEDMFVELEELIEKEDSFMSEGYLPWSRISAPTDDRCLACRVVDDTKWSLSYDRHIPSQESCDRVYLREFDLLLDVHRGKYASKSLSEHGLSRTRRTLHEDIMPACRCDKKSSFRLFLTMDRREIDYHTSSRNTFYIEFFGWFHTHRSL